MSKAIEQLCRQTIWRFSFGYDLHVINGSLQCGRGCVPRQGSDFKVFEEVYERYLRQPAAVEVEAEGGELVMLPWDDFIALKNVVEGHRASASASVTPSK